MKKEHGDRLARALEFANESAEYHVRNYAVSYTHLKANTESFGNPVPTRVNVDIKKGPFIVVSGHDLNDLSPVSYTHLDVYKRQISISPSSTNLTIQYVSPLLVPPPHIRSKASRQHHCEMHLRCMVLPLSLIHIFLANLITFDSRTDISDKPL